MILNSKNSSLGLIFSSLAWSVACGPEVQNGSEEASRSSTGSTVTLDEKTLVSSRILDISSELKNHSVITNGAATCATVKRSKYNSGMVFDLRADRVAHSGLGKIAASGYFASPDEARATLSKQLTGSYLAMTLCLQNSQNIANLMPEKFETSGTSIKFSLRKHKDLRYSSTITGVIELKKFTAEAKQSSGNLLMHYYAPSTLTLNAIESADSASITFANEQGKPAIETRFKNYASFGLGVADIFGFTTISASLKCPRYETLNTDFNLTIQADAKDSHPEIAATLALGAETLESKNLLTLKARRSSDSTYRYNYSIAKPGNYSLTVKRKIETEAAPAFDFQTIDWSKVRFESSRDQNDSDGNVTTKIPNETVFYVTFEATENCKLKAVPSSLKQQQAGASLTVSN